MGKRGRNQRKLEAKERMYIGNSGGMRARTFFSALILIWLWILCGFAEVVCADGAHIEDYEGRPIAVVELRFENSPPDATAEAEFTSLLKVAPNTDFSAALVRDSLQALFDSGRVANARVEAINLNGSKTGPVRLRFVIQRQVVIAAVRLAIAPANGTPISE